MSTVNECHYKAMEWTELALQKRAQGNREESLAAFEQALDHELDAIGAMDGIVEPTWSVLHRSAATLALDCLQFRKAEQLVATALAQDPPAEIAEELRDLLRQILRHTVSPHGHNDANLESVQSRSVLFPRLEQTVRLATVSISGAEWDRFKDQKSAEEFLAESVQFIFGIPPRHFMSYFRWNDIADSVLDSLKNEQFQEQMKRSLGGNNEDSLNKIVGEMASWTSAIGQSKERLPDQEAFALCVTRNMIMNHIEGQDSSLGTLSKISDHSTDKSLDTSDYSTNKSIVQSLYGNLSRFDEKALQLWVAVTQASFNAHIIPSAKSGFNELLAVQVPFSSSPEIFPMTLEKAVKYLRGAGVFTFAGKLCFAGFCLVAGEAAIAAKVAGTGVTVSLVLISSAQLLPHLEAAMDRGFSKYLGRGR